MPGPNLMLPGNPRYQPKELVPYFGYDNLFRGVGQVELAVIDTLAEIGVIPTDDYALLNDGLRERVLSITTTEVDKVEQEVTKHDIRAWVRLAQQILPPKLARWVHVPLTSYDALDSGRILVYAAAYDDVIRPAIARTITAWYELVEEHAGALQIGRTHGQHALPITVGFWLATILGRVGYCLARMDQARARLGGKISGAVGAYNAQVGLGISARCTGETFETKVLKRIGLLPVDVSTQVVQPEPLADFLWAAVEMSAALAQFGRDCRHLMRSEIGEVVDPFEPGQVGSSTMAHKRNPINFENLEGMFEKQRAEFGKVLSVLISEHQRDLVGSCVLRDLPIILVNLMVQLNTLLRRGKTDARPFVRRIGINKDACLRNFEASSRFVLAEPIYIALQMAGYEGDAHELVNHKAMPRAQADGASLFEAVNELAFRHPETEPGLAAAVQQIPEPVKTLLCHAEQYTGCAAEEAMRLAMHARRKI